jgi:hypothetical protein
MTLHPHQTVKVADANLVFREFEVPDTSPVGSQIAAAAGFAPNQQVTILQWQEDGAFEDVRPDEVVVLRSMSRFIAVESDASYRITIDGRRIDWPVARISGAVVRALGNVPSSKTIYFERQDHPDRPVADDAVIDLRATGVEAFYSRAATWLLNVQGVRLDVHQPTIVTRDALVQAGFNPDQGWHIFLKVAGQPKQPVELTTVIDLRTPGIEKLRLTPKDVSNGERSSTQRKDFALLPVDEAHLDTRFAFWETVTENGRRWLLIHGFPVPEGYNARRCTLALEVPPSYPVAQIDMFYALPALMLQNGVSLPNTEATVSIEGQVFQRWSRHRGPGSEWLNGVDNVVTHLALVESSLLKEVAQ